MLDNLKTEYCFLCQSEKDIKADEEWLQLTMLPVAVEVLDDQTTNFKPTLNEHGYDKHDHMIICPSCIVLFNNFVAAVPMHTSFERVKITKKYTMPPGGKRIINNRFVRCTWEHRPGGYDHDLMLQVSRYRRNPKYWRFVIKWRRLNFRYSRIPKDQWHEPDPKWNRIEASFNE